MVSVATAPNRKSLREDNLGLSGRSIFRTVSGYPDGSQTHAFNLSSESSATPWILRRLPCACPRLKSEENPLPNTASSLPQPFPAPTAAGPEPIGKHGLFSHAPPFPLGP